MDASIPDSVLGDVVVCPYNEPELARALIRKHAHEIAAVIVEPVLGSMGMIPATHEFLRALREASAENDVLLIFDEVITLRVADGGAQALYGVTPDLTAMGKIIGGGLPIGAFGGRTDLMRMFHPDQNEPVMHASTFSGNPISMAAGEASMSQVNPQLIAHMNGLGERLAQRIRRRVPPQRHPRAGNGSRFAREHPSDRCRPVEFARRDRRAGSFRPHQSAAAPVDADARRGEREPADVLHIGADDGGRSRLRGGCTRRCAAQR